MSSTPNSPEFLAGLGNLIKNMVDDARARYPVEGKDITLSSRAIDGTCQFLTNCIVASGVDRSRVQTKVDASRGNPNGETTVFEASVSIDGKVLYRLTGLMFNALAAAAVVVGSSNTSVKRDPESARAASLALEFRTALKALLDQYPQSTTPFAITEKEVAAFIDFAEPFFVIGGFTTQHACQTGPDTGRDTFVLTMFTVAIFKGRGKVYEMDISPEYIRAFLTARTHGEAEAARLETQPFERIAVGVEVKVLDEELYWGKDIAPRGSEDSAGIDLMAAVTEDTFLEPGETKLIPTGLAFYLANPNFVGLIHPRSGLGHKHGIVLGNLTGVIDADYNGQLMVSLWNRNTQGEAFKISRGDRIAQYLIQPVVKGDFKQVKEFTTPSERGGKGFGSSGVGQQVMSGTLETDGKTAHVHSEKPYNRTPMAEQLDKLSHAEKEPVNLDDLLIELQKAIDARPAPGADIQALSETEIEWVIRWALGFIEVGGGDPTELKVVVERSQDWNHEAGQLFNRRANITIFHGNRLARIVHSDGVSIFKNYVNA